MAQTVRSRIKAATKRLRKFDQEHLIRFVAQLEPSAQLTLVEEIENLDLELIDRLIKPNGSLARILPTGATILWTAAILAGFLILYLLRGAG